MQTSHDPAAVVRRACAVRRYALATVFLFVALLLAWLLTPLPRGVALLAEQAGAVVLLAGAVVALAAAGAATSVLHRLDAR